VKELLTTTALSFLTEKVCTMRSAILTISLLTLVLLSNDLSAHGGGTNSYGCHNQSSTSTHHCHSGDYNGLSFSSQDAFLAYVKEQSESTTSVDTTEVTVASTYNRDDYLPAWGDDDGDCINTRHEVLIIESLVPVTMNDSGCLVSTGEWYDPITGQTFTESSDVDIDHHVALSEAHRSGADVWPSEEKKAFANDLLNSFSLQAMDDSTNSSKSDKDPANWLPPNEGHHCDYVKNWVEVKSLYNLTYDDAEKVAIEAVLGTTIDYGARKSVTGLLASTAAPAGRFSLGITNGTSCGYSSAGSVFTSTLIDFSITPASDHLNQTVDIIIVAVLGSDIYSISDKLQLIPYTGDATKLAAFIPSTTFQESRQFEFIQATFNDPLSVSLYLAYRLESGDLVYSPEPFTVAVK
jgi:hypothetical protein